MKKATLIERIRNSEPTASTALRIGDIVTHEKQDHLVWLVDDSRAALLPLSNLSAPSENISPTSPLPLVKRLGIKGAVAFLESKTTTKAAKKAVSNDEPKLGKLGGYLGHTVVSVIRTLGKAGWDFKTTRAAFDTAGIQAADQTLRIQLKTGRDGKGSYAPLTQKEIATLRGSRGSKAKAAKPAKGKVVKLPVEPTVEALPVAA